MRKSGLLLAVTALAAAGFMSPCNGTVAGSTSGTNGSNSTQLENLTGLDSITVGMPLHVAGLVLFNTSGSSTEILADRVVTPEN